MYYWGRKHAISVGAYSGVDYSGDIFHVFVLYVYTLVLNPGQGVFKRFQR